MLVRLTQHNNFEGKTSVSLLTQERYPNFALTITWGNVTASALYEYFDNNQATMQFP